MRRGRPRSVWAPALLIGICWIGGCQVDEAPALPRLGRVPPFTLVDQNGAAVTHRTLAGRPWVAAFFFTRCPTVCPLITARMQKLQKLAVNGGGPLRLVSVTVDPEHDRAVVLKRFAISQRADWSLLTGSAEAVKALANSFAVALEGRADPDELNFGILHSGQLILVDGAGTIRGYYKSNEDGVESRIVADARRLRAEG